ATNVQGQYLGTPALDRLFAVLNKRKAVVILHPHRPEPVNREVMQQTPLAMQEYLSETTRAVANIISRNVLAHYPDVKVVVPHCGAYLPLAIPRMKSLAPVMQQNQMVGDINWEANLSALYYDLAGAHSPEVVRMLLTITTPDHLLYGSDYPYVAPQVLTASIARMRQYLTDEPDLAPYKEMILHKNAKWLFGLSKDKPAVGARNGKMLVRIAEIEVYPQYLSEYLTYANEVDRLSMEREPGVVCLFPMQSAEDSTQIRILEIYASEEAYQSHIKTEHFLKYKQGTLHMVKSLKLPSMQPLDPKTMKLIFHKER
ncbi:MAG: amidohydrolase family protein, partial [Prevotella sp.]|nr:amidohydrolase family protein [Prevotella sp.]